MGCLITDTATMDEDTLGVGNRTLHGMSLLRNFGAGASQLDHLDHVLQMTVSAIQALDNSWV